MNKIVCNLDTSILEQTELYKDYRFYLELIRGSKRELTHRDSISKFVHEYQTKCNGSLLFSLWKGAKYENEENKNCEILHFNPKNFQYKSDKVYLPKDLGIDFEIPGVNITEVRSMYIAIVFVDKEGWIRFKSDSNYLRPLGHLF